MSRANLFFILFAVLIMAAGILLRAVPSASFKGIGYDEYIYARYIGATKMAGGFSHYKDVVGAYEANQEVTEEAIVTPLRINYILTGYLWTQAFRASPLGSLHAIAVIYSVLMLCAAGVFAWRASGKNAVLVMLALSVSAPLQIWLGQRALVDGPFAFWATVSFWLLWENLRAPGKRAWLGAFVFSLFMMTLTKEFSAFVVFSFLVLIAMNRWLKFGTVTAPLLACIVAGPAVAVAILMWYAGGIGAFFHSYLLLVQKSRTLEYAVLCQDGPWSRYLIDFLLVTPLVFLLAVGRIFQLRSTNRVEIFCAVFLLATYIPMAGVTFGMSMRFAAFWEVPLCFLASSQINSIAARVRVGWRSLVLVGITTLVAAVSVYQYFQLFVWHPMYEPITRNILFMLRFVK